MLSLGPNTYHYFSMLFEQIIFPVTNWLTILFLLFEQVYSLQQLFTFYRHTNQKLAMYSYAIAALFIQPPSFFQFAICCQILRLRNRFRHLELVRSSTNWKIFSADEDVLSSLYLLFDHCSSF